MDSETIHDTHKKIHKIIDLVDIKALNTSDRFKNQQKGYRNRIGETLKRRTAIRRGITRIPEIDYTSGIGFVFMS
jgi:hypothetical protein